MTKALSDPAITKWTATCATDVGGTRPPPGGIVLQDVRHDGHNFARDLRLIGIRIKVEEVTPAGKVVSKQSVFLSLSAPFGVGEIRELKPTPMTVPTLPAAKTAQRLKEASELLQFETFFTSGVNHVAYGVAADYHLAKEWFAAQWSNCEVSHLWVDQRFLFSQYASAPPHEPSGELKAARCHPVVKYAFTPNPAIDRKRNYQRVASIRFDYRLHLALDRHFAKPDPSPLSQNAGLFRDRQRAAVEQFFIADVVFAAIEKPLVFEVWSYGLWEGTPHIGPRTGKPSKRTWDNLHWWGTRKAGDPIISAPGAFHAAHMHWRWGAAGAALRSRIPEIDTGGVPEDVAGHSWGDASERVLVDPQIWIQTLRVAVARNEPALDPTTPGAKLEEFSQEDWETLFTGLRATPLDIEAGADIALWYSSEVHATTEFPVDGTAAKTYRSALGGSVFVHGIFFAHNPEQGGAAVGSTDPEHWPRSVADLRKAPTWFRPGS